MSENGSKCSCPPGFPCGKDDCQALEQNLVKPPIDDFIIVPQALLCECHICVRSLALNSAAEEVLSLPRDAKPVLLARTWQFRRRAALPPRSPSLA